MYIYIYMHIYISIFDAVPSLYPALFYLFLPSLINSFLSLFLPSSTHAFRHILTFLTIPRLVPSHLQLSCLWACFIDALWIPARDSNDSWSDWESPAVRKEWSRRSVIELLRHLKVTQCTHSIKGQSDENFWWMNLYPQGILATSLEFQNMYIILMKK